VQAETSKFFYLARLTWLISGQQNTIQRIINAFKKTYGIDRDREVFIVFDGDRLDPDSTVASHDFEDLDCLDVTVV
jgi:hypothetical protein